MVQDPHLSREEILHYLQGVVGSSALQQAVQPLPVRLEVPPQDGPCNTLMPEELQRA